MGTDAGGRQVSVAETLAAQDWLSIAQQSQVEVVAFLQEQVRFPSVTGRNDGRICAHKYRVQGDSGEDESGRPTMAQERPADRQQDAGEDGDVEAAYSTANRTLNSK